MKIRADIADVTKGNNFEGGRDTFLSDMNKGSLLLHPSSPINEIFMYKFHIRCMPV